MNTDQPLYPIREVSRLTGVNSITLRAWERRYDLIQPIRTDSGHRLYNQTHIDLIKQAVELTRQGVQISQVKSLLESKSSVKVPAEVTSWRAEIDFANEMTLACQQCDFIALNALLDRMFSDLNEIMAMQVLMSAEHNIHSMSLSAPEVVWRSCVMPRLMTRLRYFCQQSNSKSKVVCYVQDVSLSPNPVKLALVCLVLAAQGYLPFNSIETLCPKDLNKDLLKSIQAQSIFLVSSSESDLGQWLEWSQSLSTYDVNFVMDNDIPELSDLPVNVQFQTYSRLVG
jgi:DNA-binding transcriptional MerR regulator